VEGEIDRGIVRHRLPVARVPFSVASRTDRGVSAVGNALVLTSALSGPALLRSLNGLSPKIFFTAAAVVPEDFQVRAAVARMYRYFEPTPPADPARWERAARLFRGSIDARSFGRALPAAHPQWRTIDSVTVSSTPPGLVVEVRARSFVWGMVRKIVGALREVDRERLSLARLSSVLAGHERLTLPMAEPEPLVLWDVELPVRWEYHWTGPNRHQVRWWQASLAAARTRQRVLEAMETVRSPSEPFS
jgi:tRNA pseudouridine38-40 synthase